MLINGKREILDNFSPSNRKQLELLKFVTKTIHTTIKQLSMDLKDYTVLTEAATGHWIFLPLIAVMSGSKQTICFTKDSKHGKAIDIKKNLKNIAAFLNIEKKISIYTELPKSLINKADIVTNSGHLRPLNSNFLQHLKKTAVITLMWEPWEFRKTDLDLEYCWNSGISILGVNEHNTILNCMAYASPLIKNILKSCNIDIKNKHVLLVGENISSTYIFQYLISSGSKVYCISKTLKNEFQKLNSSIIGTDLSEKNVEYYLKRCDLIIIASIPLKKKIIGGRYGLPISKLKKLCPNVKIVVYHGNVDYVNLKKSKIQCFPEENPRLGHMGWTADILGPKVSIETLALGLKAGEVLAKFRKLGYSSRDTEINALETPFCLDFPAKIRKKYGIKEK